MYDDANISVCTSCDLAYILQLLYDSESINFQESLAIINHYNLGKVDEAVMGKMCFPDDTDIEVKKCSEPVPYRQLCNICSFADSCLFKEYICCASLCNSLCESPVKAQCKESCKASCKVPGKVVLLNAESIWDYLKLHHVGILGDRFNLNSEDCFNTLISFVRFYNDI